MLTLIDFGATSNFISHQLVKTMMLRVEDTPIFVVEIGTREKVRNKGGLQGVEVLGAGN